MRYVVGLILVLMLAACSGTAPLRPGQTTAAELESRTLPVGKRYDYRMDFDQLPIAMTISFVSSRQSATRMRYAGEMAMSVTDQELADAMAAMSSLGGGAPEYDGQAVRMKMNFVTDMRGRTVSGSMFGAPLRYRPHDCFATLGTCRYRETDSGVTTHYIVETTEENGTWTSITVLDPDRNPGDTSRTLTQYTLDADGFLRDGDFSITDAGFTMAVTVRRLN